MAINKIECYIIECDSCGKMFENEREHTIFPDEETADKGAEIFFDLYKIYMLR